MRPPQPLNLEPPKEVSDMKNDRETERKLEQAAQKIHGILDGVGSVIVGQKTLLDRMIMALLCQGHVLIEGVPGLAKSLMVQSLASALNVEFRRIQFTPDLLPADLTGTQVYNPKEGEFSIKKGPVFSNMVLADEINRAPPKVQSALLEAMQERQVSLGDRTLDLPRPFMVMATQNPIEHEGTYPLPEAQVDRFLFKLDVPYPSQEEERRIVNRMAGTGLDLSVEPVMDAAAIIDLQKLVNEIYVDEKIERYVVSLVTATRDPGSWGIDSLCGMIRYGASPRASVLLVLAAKASALMQGRTYVTPKDVKSVGPDVLRHRLLMSYEAHAREMTASHMISVLFDSIEVP